jgi:spermidine synthase
MDDKPKPNGGEQWIEERFWDYFATRFKIKKVLFSGKSPYQKVDVLETEGHGRMLLNDGLVMITERDEFVYHEMIVHVPLFVHPEPRRVLVIGGGDGGTVREVLRHKTVDRCVLVEIDDMVVDACRQFIPQTASCLDDPRVTVTIGDGVEFVAKTQEKFDVVIVDSTDPIGPATPLFGPEFYGNVKKTLTDKGIVVSQGESAFYAGDTQKALLRILAGLFDRVNLYNYTNMSYPGGLWSFTFASRGLRPVWDLEPERVQKSGLDFQYYSADVHRGAFAIPAFMRKNLAEFLSEV